LKSFAADIETRIPKPAQVSPVQPQMQHPMQQQVMQQ
jgi:hypothetical protein